MAKKIKNVLIRSGQSLSDPIDIEGFNVIGIIIPYDWGTANITFQAAPLDGPIFYDVFQASGDEFSLVAVPGKYIPIGSQIDYDSGSNSPLARLNNLRIRSGTSAAPVNQSAQQVIGLVLL